MLEVEAASRERERLARGIHDSVLQVLALAARRGAEAGGEAAELGRLTGQQEAALRTLVAATPANDDDQVVDLCALLLPAQTEGVTVSVPAQAVLLKKAAAQELGSAVGAALDNVRRHCGDHAKAWVLVEEELDLVTVTIRDDGPGIPDGRLAEAAAAGRLGEQQDVLDAVKAGATGYLLKSSARDEFLDAVRRTADGDAVFTPGLAALVLGEFRRLAASPAEAASEAPQLSGRETEILRMVATGLSYKQIASRLVLSHRTVQNHVQNTLSKLHLHNRVELVRYAIEHGLDGEATHE